MNVGLIQDDPRTRQYDAYSGQQPSEPMPTGTYIEVRRVGRDLTLSDACWEAWDYFNRHAQLISASGHALKPLVTKDLVMQAFTSVNICFAEIAARVRTRANRLFSDTFGGPHRFAFEPYPIRWPGESREAMKIVMGFVSAAFQVPQVKSNLLDHGILDNHAKIMLRPLFDLKADMMRSYFGLEVQGEISVDELDAVFRDGGPMPPLNVSMGDHRDTSAMTAAEDERAMSNESAKVPTGETLDAITSGVEVWTFVPTLAHWTTFGEVQRRREIDGPQAIPGEPFRFGGGTVSSTGASGGSSGGGTATVTPQ